MSMSMGMNNKYKNKMFNINLINLNNYKPRLLTNHVSAEKKEECTICFEDCNAINKDLGLNQLDCYCHCNCKYYVHVNCLRKWITVKSNCLMCKQKIFSFHAPLTIANNQTGTTQPRRYMVCCKIIVFSANVAMIFSSFYVILYTCFLLLYVIINANPMQPRRA